MKKNRGPFPSPDFRELLAANMVAPLRDTISGEITFNAVSRPLGTYERGGKITAVSFAVEQCGRDDSNALSIEVDVKIAGVSCLSTKPKIVGQNGAASESRHTFASGEGVTEDTINTSANHFDAGELISYDVNVVRTDTPTTEMADLALVVEVE